MDWSWLAKMYPFDLIAISATFGMFGGLFGVVLIEIARIILKDEPWI